MNNRNGLLAAALIAVASSSAWAQEDHSMETMDHEMMNHGEMNHEGMDMEGMDHSTMGHDSPAAGVRDPHAYADGYDFSQFSMRHDELALKTVLLRADRLEAVRSGGDSSMAYELQGWYGGSFDRLVLKAEGEADNGTLLDGTTELLWSHAIAPFWDGQLGVRYDHGVDPDRGWLAFGVEGLAPYWFEIGATAYVGDEGRTALRFDGEYELLLTQRLILQPRLEANLYGKRDAERALGSGLSEVTAGVRLRYEIRREFAPYIGVEWAGKFGGTADLARAAGDEAKETRAVAGVRFWF